MRRIGLTGGIASGKSTVAHLLARHGAVIVDADILAREVVGLGTPGLARVIARFGPGVVAADGTLDRTAMGEIVFADPGARADLESIIHPEVRRRAAELEQQAARDAVVVHVIPLLVETGQAGLFDLVVVVDCDPADQAARLMVRNGLTREQAAARLAAQATRGQRLAAAGLVIHNDGSFADLDAAVTAAWPEIAGVKTVGGGT